MYQENPQTCSLNNFFPDEESSGVEDGEMTGFCMQTESVWPNSDKTNGHRSSVCDGVCSLGDRPAGSQLESNKLHVLQDESRTKSGQPKLPLLIVTPSTPERICDEPDKYEISL